MKGLLQLVLYFIEVKEVQFVLRRCRVGIALIKWGEAFLRLEVIVWDGASYLRKFHF